MNLIEWNASYITGIDIIDSQHKILINKANKLNSCIQEFNFSNNLKILLDELLEYTFYHFDTEEELFSKYEYSDKINHLKEHNDFKNYIKNFLNIENINNMDEGRSLLIYLKYWINHHIREIDMKYVSFLKEKLNK